MDSRLLDLIKSPSKLLRAYHRVMKEVSWIRGQESWADSYLNAIDNFFWEAFRTLMRMKKLPERLADREGERLYEALRKFIENVDDNGMPGVVHNLWRWSYRVYSKDRIYMKYFDLLADFLVNLQNVLSDVYGKRREKELEEIMELIGY